MSNFDSIVSLTKRRGFIFPGSDIYGGLSGTWDWGPLGFFLKENIKREWWQHMLREDHIYPLDAAILMSAKVWEASGHLDYFSDPLVDCKKCKKRFRADDLTIQKPQKNKCPECGGELTSAKQFQMMFKTHAGPVEDTSSLVYLRPETAQGIFVNFKNIIDAFHPSLPFGVVQVGKAFRNEITPKNFLFRAREFEQLEFEYFGHPEKMDQYFKDIRKMRLQWFLDLGIQKQNIRTREHKKEELSHYSRSTTDLEYHYGFSPLAGGGFSELEGIANRGSFDLSQHEKMSGEKLQLEGITPHVIESSLGLDRAVLAFLVDAYDEDNVGGESRVVLRLNPKLAPYKVGVFPLVTNKEKIVAKARAVYKQIKSPLSHLQAVFDDIGNIGKRYRRQDEIGTPWCVTIDYQTLEDDTVTIRDRDTAKQIRKKVAELDPYFTDMLR